MPDQTAVPTYAELMDRAIRAEEKIVRLISEAERTEERLTDERNDARARIAELEAQQPYREVWSDEVAPGGMVCSTCGQPVESEPCPQHAPAGYVVGWQDGDRVEIALDESELPDLLPGPDRHAYTSIGEAHAFVAEIAPEDPDTQFRVYELREVAE